MAGTMFSPPRNVDIMLKNRNAANKLRNGSPKFKDILRERCRTRVKENRGKFLNLLRNVSNNELKKVLTDTICQEVMEFDNVLKNEKRSEYEITNLDQVDNALITMDEMREEALEAEVKYLMHTYDMLMANDEALFSEMLEDDLEGLLDCPLCQKGYMVQSNNHILCIQCNVCVPARLMIEEVSQKMQSCIDTHRSVCLGHPQFSVIPDDGNGYMYLTCAKCSYSNLIV